MSSPSVQRIDKFDVLRRLGRGGMGSVYLARDPDIDRLVAIKLLHEGFDEEDLRGRFTAEAKSASALRHTNIVTIFQTGTFLSRPFIVMEYVAGETFADIIVSGKALSIGEALQLIDQLLAGLYYAHAKGIVHRDIKPSNVMVDGEGVVRILDFGIARFGDGGGLTRTGVVLGTLNYMSPEQLGGKAVDARTDIFAVGLVAYELLAGKPAFPQAFPEVVTRIGFHDPPPLEELCPGIDARLVEIVGRCLAKQADDRYASCADVRRDLDAVRQAVGGGDVAQSVARAVTSPSPSVAAPDSRGDTLLIDSRRPPTSRPGALVEAASAQTAEMPMTVAIPRPMASSSIPSPSIPPPSTGVQEVVDKARPHSRVPLVVSAGAVLLVMAIAIGFWRQTVSPDGPSGQPATVSTDAGARPQTAVDTAAPVGTPAAGAETSSTDSNEPAKEKPPSESAPASVDTPRQPVRTRAPQPAPVRVGGAVKAPKQIKRVDPVYPPMAISARLKGVVILEATIRPDGKVGDVRVLRSIPLLDAAAADAVRQWEYEPTTIKGVAVPVITTVAVEFTLAPPQPVQVGGAIKPPTQTKRVDPPYPPEALAAGVQGVVIMEATIGADGKVTDVRVLRSIPLLDQAAMDAVRQWEYTPTLLNGLAVPVRMSVTVNFTLKPATPPAALPPAK